MEKILTQALLSYQPAFSEEDLRLGLALFETRTFQANELILEIGEVCDYLFFAEESITRCYYLDIEGEERTLWMKPEQTFITEYKSFVNRESSRFALQFYEPTQVWMLSRKNLLHLYEVSPRWSQFGIAMTEKVHISLIDVFVNLLANDATRNYQYIEYMFPRFIQVAPLKDIASMLNISQVSLSRIRAGTQLKK